MGNDVSSVVVDAGKIVSPVSRLIFGNFIEHIRDCVEALHAEKLKNRRLAAAPDTTGTPPPWVPLSPESEIICGVITGKDRDMARGVRIRSSGRRAGIAQLGICVRPGHGYVLRLRLRAEGEVKDVSAALTCSEHGELARVGVSDIGGDFSESVLRLVPSAESQEAEFEIAFGGTGTLYIECASLMPADAVGGVPVEVLHVIQQLAPPVLRYPGGCFADVYHWRDGVGPVDERPTVENAAWGGIETNDFGTDEFINLCRNLGSEPLICVNFGTGDPEEAAAWVEYCNGPADSKYGSMRAANGHPAPYGVKFWEIGNEIYGKWEKGHCDAESYAAKYLEFRKAMKAVDGDIELLAVGHTDAEWNRAVLSAAGSEMEYLTMHFYEHGAKDVPAEEQYRRMAGAPAKYDRLIRNTERLIREVCGESGPSLAITEWNTMYRPPGERTMTPREHTLEAAIFNAGLLNVFMRNTAVVKICNFSDLVNGWVGGCIRVGDFLADVPAGKPEGWSGCDKDIVYGTPTYHVLRVYGDNARGEVLETAVTSETFTAGEAGRVAYLDAVATIGKEKDVLSLFVVNRDAVAGTVVRFELRGFEPEPSARVLTLAGDVPENANTPNNPEAIIPVTTKLTGVGREFEYELPPCSVTAIILEKKRTEGEDE